MSNPFCSKSWIAIISAASLVALTSLAIGLRNVTFLPGQITGQRESAVIRSSVAKVVGEIQEVVWWEQLMLWGVFFLLVVLVGFLMTPEGRRRLLRGFIRFAAVFWCIYFLMKYRGDFLAELGMGLQTQLSNTQTGPAEPPPVFEPPQLSSIVMIAVSLGITLALLLLFLGVNRWWQRRQVWARSRSPIEEIAGIARGTLADLTANRDWDGVIVDCYARMSQVVEKQRGLSRQEAMTPTEFAIRLEKAGLPPQAVHGLTRLFEGVRYGARQPTQVEVNSAVTCLTAIVRFCGERT